MTRLEDARNKLFVLAAVADCLCWFALGFYIFYCTGVL